MIYSYDYQGNTYTINLEPQPNGEFQAIIGEHTYTFEAIKQADGGWQLQFGSQRQVVYGVMQGDERFIYVDGVHYQLEAVDERTQRRKKSASGGDHTAQMPGQVMALLVSEGEVVERGQTLVVLEAMKMEIRVPAAQEGTVKTLKVAEGDVVQRGQVLVELE